jgi:WD40 repeat protein
MQSLPTGSIVCAVLVAAVVCPPGLCQEDPTSAVTPAAVLEGLRRFYRQTARTDGSFQPGVDPAYLGMSDSAYSDLAPVTYACTVHKTFDWRLPHEDQTAEFLLARQREGGEFVNVAGTVDPQSPQGRTYNTTQGLVALRALGRRPRFDPLPVFEAILRQDYKTLPTYSTSFFPLAYLCAGEPIPEKADRDIRALMTQDEDGYLDDHIAATFHASHYYSLVGQPTPKARQMVARILRDQKPDGSWMLNLPSRDRHATFDAVFTLLHEGGGRADCREAIGRAARWSLSCRNPDGGFGHFPGSTSDADAAYFHVGTLVMAGFLQPADPLPADPHLLSWGHLMPVRTRDAKAGTTVLELPSDVGQAFEPAEHGAEARTTVLHLPGWVGGLAFSPDGRALATASSDGHARTWDDASGDEQTTFAGHADCVVSVAIASDGALVATGSFDHTAKVWRADTGQCLHTLAGHRGAVMSVAFAPDSSLLATASVDGTIKFWDPVGGTLARTLEGHKSWVNAIAFSPDGETLLSGSSDGTIKVWSVETGELGRTLTASRAEVRSVAVSPDGRSVAAGIRYGAIKVWDATTWEERLSFDGHPGDVWGVAFLGDGQRLVSGDGDWNRPGLVKVWSLADGALIDERRHTGEVLSLAISPDGETIAAGGGDRTVSIWRLGP